VWYKFSQLKTPLKLPDGSVYIPEQSAIKNPAAVQQLTGFTYEQLPKSTGAAPTPVMQPAQTTNKSTALEPQKRETVPMNSNFIPSDAQVQNASKQMQTEMFGRANQFGPTAQELKRYLEGKPSVPGGLGSGQLVVEK